LSPDEKPHNQIDHILVDRGSHSNALDVRSSRAADCDIDHYPVVAKVGDRLAVIEKVHTDFIWRGSISRN
jgi:hypothetical protein